MLSGSGTWWTGWNIPGGHDSTKEGRRLWSLTGPLERKCSFLHSLLDFISHSVI